MRTVCRSWLSQKRNSVCKALSEAFILGDLESICCWDLAAFCLPQSSDPSCKLETWVLYHCLRQHNLHGPHLPHMQTRKNVISVLPKLCPVVHKYSLILCLFKKQISGPTIKIFRILKFWKFKEVMQKRNLLSHYSDHKNLFKMFSFCCCCC